MIITTILQQTVLWWIPKNTSILYNEVKYMALHGLSKICNTIKSMVTGFNGKMSLTQPCWTQFRWMCTFKYYKIGDQLWLSLCFEVLSRRKAQHRPRKLQSKKKMHDGAQVVSGVSVVLRPTSTCLSFCIWWREWDVVRVILLLLDSCTQNNFGLF